MTTIWSAVMCVRPIDMLRVLAIKTESKAAFTLGTFCIPNAFAFWALFTCYAFWSFCCGSTFWLVEVSTLSHDYRKSVKLRHPDIVL